MIRTSRWALFILLSLCLFVPLGNRARELTINNISFACRVPKKYDENSRIMVLFGGRNWPGEKTLATFDFNQLADDHSLFLISPSFQDREYWEPALWSGRTLLAAVARLEKNYRLKPGKLYLYGYSAGGQCAALFYDWMPQRVAAWGAHGCGVYPESVRHVSTPALISCGIQDAERFQISRHFLYRYRENGGLLLWKPFPGGHELNPEALELARAWFDALLSGAEPEEFGEDDTMQIDRNIDVEFRNPLYNRTLRELWRK